MAVAPDRTTLYDIENTVLSASYEILNGAGIPVYRQRDGADEVTPRVTLQAFHGAPTGHCFVSGSKAFYDVFSGNIQVLVFTDNAFNSVSQSVLKNQCLYYLTDKNNFNSGSLMPYHQLARADLQSVQTYVESDPDNLDISGISINYVIVIKPSAWPNET